MMIKSKVVCITVMTMISLFIGLISLDAAWWDDKKDMPVPQNTQEVKKEKRLILGIEFDFTYYTSTLSNSQIKDFYRAKLAGLGWTQKDYIKEAAEIPDLQANDILMKTFEDNLVFTKDEEQIIITFLPRKLSSDEKTKFTICYAKIGRPTELTALTAQANELPQLLAKPKKEVAPTYPGAALITLSEQPNFLKASYLSKDDIGSVLAFYKANMASYGWELVEEAPLAKKLASEFVGPNAQQYCPSCSNSVLSNPSLELQYGQLTFSNQTGDVCKIVLSNAKTGPEAKSPIMLTTILVDYVQKK